MGNVSMYSIIAFFYGNGVKPNWKSYSQSIKNDSEKLLLIQLPDLLPLIPQNLPDEVSTFLNSVVAFIKCCIMHYSSSILYHVSTNA